MKSCSDVEQLFEGYFRSDLSPAEELALLEHLKNCKSCPEQLDNFYEVHLALSDYDRPTAPRDVLNSFYQKVDLSFGRETLADRIKLAFVRLTGKRSRFFRTIQFVLLIIIGLVIGWIVFAPTEPQIVYQSNDPYQYSQPISKVDLEDIHKYLQIAEMILLQIQNDPDFYLDRELAQKLLVKTFRANETATQLNHLRLIIFLNRMELILLEASNLNEEDKDASMALIRKVIEDSNLLREVKELRSRIKISKEGFGT
jgi:hypothetical protein